MLFEHSDDNLCFFFLENGVMFYFFYSRIMVLAMFNFQVLIWTSLAEFHDFGNFLDSLNFYFECLFDHGDDPSMFFF